MPNGVSVRARSSGPGTGPTGRRRRRTARWRAGPGRGCRCRGAEQVGDLQRPGGQDDRGGEQEGEPRGVLAGQAAEHARHHRHPGPADPGQQGEICAEPIRIAGRIGRVASRRSDTSTAACSRRRLGVRARGVPAHRHQFRTFPLPGAGGVRRHRRAPPRKRSPAIRMMPFTMRNAAAYLGWPKMVRKACSNNHPGDADRDRGKDDHPGEFLIQR